MGARIIDGRAVAAEVRERVRRQVQEVVERHGVRPGLATVLVGEDPASQIYVRNKRRLSEEAGMVSIHHDLPAEATQAEVEELIRSLNADESVHGILLQLPVPPQIDGDAMTRLIDPAKDVDGLTPLNAGLLLQGLDGLVSCTPAGVMELLRAHDVELEGAEAVVVGRSKLVGKPLAALLLAANATVTQAHSRTRDLAEVCRRADVLIAAVGVPRLVTAEMVRPGAVVIDVGVNRTADGLAGDVDFEAVKEKASLITPVPGGVGPMTIAMLLQNAATAAERQLAARSPR
ncbi:MAG: bifunctional methylenetetrahydrofolate dehydrogenase/methenyltetrahydrofolate cyclohydrolase FolD [Thermoleophilaceae bacterium]|nr:bifunctional methylenetetrahydrofolate dehydrogenase/methenyltetrahydrofolate cyclohydrolase FolD [Thermoleophilaceae bacterium]